VAGRAKAWAGRVRDAGYLKEVGTIRIMNYCDFALSGGDLHQLPMCNKKLDPATAPGNLPLHRPWRRFEAILDPAEKEQ
jgi:hypothetical protein